MQIINTMVSSDTLHVTQEGIFLSTLPKDFIYSTQKTIQLSTQSSPLETRELIILPICALVIVLLNLLVVGAFVYEKKLRRRPANVLIFSQAMIDFVIGTLFIPFHIIEKHYKTEIILNYLIYYILFISLFNLLALSADRYLALSMPFFHYRVVDKRRTVRLLIIVWIVPLFLTLIPLCWEFKFTETKSKYTKTYLTISWAFMLILVLLMTILYLFIVIRARKTIRKKRLSIEKKSFKKKVELERKELRVIHLFGLLLFFFVAAYIPILYMNYYVIIDMINSIPPIVEILSIYSLILNSLVNPVLCIYLKQDYSQVILTIIQFKVGFIIRSTSKSSSTKTNLTELAYECEYSYEGSRHNNSKKNRKSSREPYHHNRTSLV
ncbi:adenosine receptor A3 isoform X2 [Hydra vulgaris]|uniref:adenosine receptor A3 isoform X2 n=2 Tax=Hydra vulgaris TaxID=6087 RepID=UPI001F5E5E29|nr:adenosine receptor A3 isoform X1 [Hydra vulgaris]